MHIPTIKTDPKRPHHYLIGVRINDSVFSKTAGKIYLAYGPVYFNNDDVDNFKHAIMLSRDKLLHTSINQALEIFNCSSLTYNINGMKIAACANNSTLHHFTTEEKFEDADEWFKIFVEGTNISKSSKNKLKEARI